MQAKKIVFTAIMTVFSSATFTQTTQTSKTDEDPEIKILKLKLDKASFSNKISDEELKARLKSIDDEFQKLSLENKLNTEKNKKEIYELSQKLEKNSHTRSLGQGGGGRRVFSKNGLP